MRSLGTVSVHGDDFVVNYIICAERDNCRTFKIGARKTLRTHLKSAEEVNHGTCPVSLYCSTHTLMSALICAAAITVLWCVWTFRRWFGIR